MPPGCVWWLAPFLGFLEPHAAHTKGGVPRSLPPTKPYLYVLIWKETPHVGEELRVYPHQ